MYSSKGLLKSQSNKRRKIYTFKDGNGVDVSLDLDNFKKSVDFLVLNSWDTHLDSLNGESNINYVLVRDYNKMFYGSENQQVFDDVITNSIKGKSHFHPNTVGAYLSSCKLANKNGCHVTCHNSYHFKDTVSCVRHVLKLDPTPTGFLLRHNHKVQNEEKAFLYVPFMSLSVFPGLSSQEKEFIKNEGIKTITILSFNSDETQTIVLQEDVPAEDIKERSETILLDNSNISLFLIILILLIIVFSFYYYRMRKHTE